ncbi:uncharacterized protein LOC105184366 isoform X1 [Harpegnathos saltator]|nr:uncharacterized protein LOC105184366 isoform X1 [Harpegnathos saltator]
MFPRGSNMLRDHRKPKKPGKKHHARAWFHSGKKKDKHKEANLFAVIMSSGDSSSPVQATMSSTDFDVPDDAKLTNISPITTPSPTTSEKISKAADNETMLHTDVEAIEEATPIVQKTPPMPESAPKLERNGFDMDTRKTLDEHEEPDMCLIDCIYYTQQCCNCTIL